MDIRLSKSIEDCADSLKAWVNVQLSGYYTAAEMDAKVAEMKAALDTVSGENAARADSLKAEIAAAKAEIDTVKANIRAEYKSAVETAITELDGKLSAALEAEIAEVNNELVYLNDRVSILETYVEVLAKKVIALEAMVQSVTIVPAYSDGSVKVIDDSLYLDCIITPSTVVNRLDTADVVILVNKVKTKAFAGVDTVKIKSGDLFEKDTTNGSLSIRVDISSKIPDSADSTITVALNINIKKGISKYTTDFVPVECNFTYVEIAGVKWALENLAISESGKREFNNTGHIIGDNFQWATYAGYCGEASGSDKGLLIYSSFTSTLCGDAENSFSFKDGNYEFAITDGYGSPGIAPYFDDDAYNYTKYTGDAELTLESTDDAATIILGEGWRMPTIEEYQSLYGATYWAWDATDCGYYVFLPSDAPGTSAGSYGAITGLDKNKAKLFFPASGYVDYSAVSPGPDAQYLSSTYDPYIASPGYLSRRFRFDNPIFEPSPQPVISTEAQIPMLNRRSIGASIRPVKAGTAE